MLTWDQLKVGEGLVLKHNRHQGGQINYDNDEYDEYDDDDDDDDLDNDNYD